MQGVGAGRDLHNITHWGKAAASRICRAGVTTPGVSDQQGKDRSRGRSEGCCQNLRHTGQAGDVNSSARGLASAAGPSRARRMRERAQAEVPGTLSGIAFTPHRPGAWRGPHHGTW